MRRILLLFSFALIFLSFNKNLNAQHYYPIPESNARWMIIYADPNPPPWMPQIYSYHNYYLNGAIVDGKIQKKGSTDTIINGIKYIRVWSDCMGQSPIGYFRQDTVSKKVYGLLDSSQTELLLFDYSLKVGDTLISYSSHCGELWETDSFHTHGVVYYVDSILLLDNSYRKNIWLASQAIHQANLIEGIGSTAGLLQGVYLGEFEFGGWDLGCMDYNGKVLYQMNYVNKPYANCDDWFNDNYSGIGLDSVETNSEKVFIFYNQSNDLVFNLSEIKNSALVLEIYTMHGQMIRTYKIQNMDQIVIPRKYLDTGVYLYQITKQSAKSLTGKFYVF